MADFSERFGLKEGGRTERLLALIEKLELLLGRPVERTEFNTLIKLLYPEIDDSIAHVLAKSIAQVRKGDVEFATVKDMQKMLGIQMPPWRFMEELNKKTQRKLAGLKGTHIPGTNAKVDAIKTQREKLRITAGVPSFFIIKAKKEEAIESLKRFWKEN